MKARGRIHASMLGIFGITALSFCILAYGKEKSDVENMKYTISLNNEEISGTYSGQVENNVPEGTGIFSTDDSYENSFCVEGKFKEGSLKGKAEFTFSDGHIEIGKVKDESYNGIFKIIETDGRYKEVQYKSGKAEGKVVFYDVSDTVAGIDWYYENHLISELKEEAEEYTTQEYYMDPYMYVDLAVKVTGTVRAVTQTDEECVIKLLDKNNDVYTVTYPNGSYDKELPTIVSAVKVGQRVSIYGIFVGITENKIENDIDYGYSFPEISAFYGEILENGEDVFAGVSLSYEYEDICNNPYAYAELDIEISGIVENVITDYKNEYVDCRVNTNRGEVYFVRIELEDLDADCFPVRGKSVKIEGTLNGNYRVPTSENEVEIYPFILGD